MEYDFTEYWQLLSGNFLKRKLFCLKKSKFNSDILLRCHKIDDDIRGEIYQRKSNDQKFHNNSLNKEMEFLFSLMCYFVLRI